MPAIDELTLNQKNEAAMSLAAQIKTLIAEGEERTSQRIAELESKHAEALEGVKEDLTKAMSAFSLPGSAEHKEKGQGYSLVKALRAVQTGDFRHAPMEKEMNDEIHAKAMSFGVDTSGGFLVPAEVTGQMIELLYAKSIVADLGATQLNDLTGAPVPIPRQTGGATAYWGGETSTITASDSTFDQLNLNPRDLFAVTVMSEKLLKLAGNASIEAMVRNDFMKVLALKIDKAVLAGTGASGEPIGILNATGVNTTSLSDPGTYNQFVQFISEVRADNALEGSLGWAMSNADMTELEQIADTQGTGTDVVIQQHERRRLLSESGDAVLGYKARVSTQLTDGQVIFGNWADAIVAQWGPIQLARTDALGFLTAQTHVRALTWADVGIRHGVSFCRPS